MEETHTHTDTHTEKSKDTSKKTTHRKGNMNEPLSEHFYHY